MKTAYYKRHLKEEYFLKLFFFFAERTQTRILVHLFVRLCKTTGSHKFKSWCRHASTTANLWFFALSSKPFASTRSEPLTGLILCPFCPAPTRRKFLEEIKVAQSYILKYYLFRLKLPSWIVKHTTIILVRSSTHFLELYSNMPLFAARKKFSFCFSQLRHSFPFFKNKSFFFSFPIFPFSFPLAFPCFLACTLSCAYTSFSLSLCSFYHGVVFNVVIFIFPRHFPAQLLHPLFIKALAFLFCRPFSALLWRCTNHVGRFAVLFVIGPREGCFYLKKGKGNCKSNGFPLR